MKIKINQALTQKQISRLKIVLLELIEDVEPVSDVDFVVDVNKYSQETVIVIHYGVELK